MTRKTAAARGYGTKWQQARRGYLIKHPFCVMCARLGQTSLATVVDHIIPHRGDSVKFWDRANWQGLCTSHHSSTKQSDEAVGFAIGNDAAGRPIDPRHPWNKLK